MKPQQCYGYYKSSSVLHSYVQAVPITTRLLWRHAVGRVSIYLKSWLVNYDKLN